MSKAFTRNAPLHRNSQGCSNPEDETFDELVEYLWNHDVPQDVKVAVAGYVGTMLVQAWHRGLVQGLSRRK